MGNTKEKLILRNDNYYATLSIEDDFGKLHKKTMQIDAKRGDSNFAIKQALNKKIEEIELNNAKKAQKFSQKLKNRKVQLHLSFAKFASVWLKAKRKSIELNTYDDYAYDVKKIQKYFADKTINIKDIQPADIDGFFDFLYKHKCSNNTILHYHVLLNQIFKFAIKNDIIDFNVMDRVDKPKKIKYEHRFYSKKQLINLIELLNAENHYLKVPIILASIYGLRRSEIVGLLWSSIDFAGRKIYINHKVIETNKNGRAIKYHSNKLKNESSKRVLPLFDFAEQILISAKKEIETNMKKLKKRYKIKYANYVCVDCCGNLISPHRLTSGFAEFLKKHNMPKIRLHDLRHSCASLLVANGISMKAVQEWLGHSNFGTTANTYSHLDFSAKQQSAQKIDEIISGYNIEKSSDIEGLKNMLQILINKVEKLENAIFKLA